MIQLRNTVRFRQTFFALQHILILAATFIYPLLIINSGEAGYLIISQWIAITVFTAGLSSFLLNLNERHFGASLLSMQSVGSAFLAPSALALQSGGPPLLYGMTFLAGLFQTTFARLFQRLTKYFPPEVTGTVIIMIGISMIHLAGDHFLDLKNQSNNIGFHLLAGMTTLSIIIGSHIWGNQFLQTISIMLATAIGFVLCFSLDIIPDRHLNLIGEQPFFTVPFMSTFKGETIYKFDANLILPFFISSAIVMIKGAGDFILAQRLSRPSSDRINMKLVSKGLFTMGIGNMLSGLLGGFGQATSSSNIGYASATNSFQRKIGLIAGLLLIIFSFFPKMMIIFAIIPSPVIGAVLVFIICYLLISGMQMVMARMMDSRKIFIIGISLFAGLVAEINPSLTEKAPLYLKPLMSSSVTIATIIAFILNLFFRIGIYKRKNIDIQLEGLESQAIENFIKHNAATWGINKELVNRITATALEFLEHAHHLNINNNTIRLYLDCDNIHVKASFVYRGDKMDLPEVRPSNEELLVSENAFLKLAGFVMRKQSDQVQQFSQRSVHKIGLYFFY